VNLFAHLIDVVVRALSYFRGVSAPRAQAKCGLAKYDASKIPCSVLSIFAV
jgi:hypothetical protein